MKLNLIGPGLTKEVDLSTVSSVSLNSSKSAGHEFGVLQLTYDSGEHENIDISTLASLSFNYEVQEQVLEVSPEPVPENSPAETEVSTETVAEVPAEEVSPEETSEVSDEGV